MLKATIAHFAATNTTCSHSVTPLAPDPLTHRLDIHTEKAHRVPDRVAEPAGRPYRNLQVPAYQKGRTAHVCISIVRKYQRIQE